MDSRGTSGVGSLFLLVCGQPTSNLQLDAMMRHLEKDLQSSWDADATGFRIEEILADLSSKQSAETTQGIEDERILKWETDAVTVTVLLNTHKTTLRKFMTSCISSAVPYRHVFFSGQTLMGSGDWILMDDVFSFADFAKIVHESICCNSEGSAACPLRLSCSAEGQWSAVRMRHLNVQLNPTVVSPSASTASQFTAYLSQHLQELSFKGLTTGNCAVGNLDHKTKPVMYVLPAGSGASAYFGIGDFNMLVDGGFQRKAAFWSLIKRLQRLDLMLLTHFGVDNSFGFHSFLDQMIQNHSSVPQIGAVLLNSGPNKFHASLNATNGLEKDEDDERLKLGVIDESRTITEKFHKAGLHPMDCASAAGPGAQPIKLYNRVGYGSLDMYVLNPVQNSQELKEFTKQWTSYSQSGTFTGVNGTPISSLVSVCALLVWTPSDEKSKVTRILLPGSVSCAKLMECLNKLKGLEMLKEACYTRASSSRNNKLEKSKLSAKPAATKGHLSISVAANSAKKALEPSHKSLLSVGTTKTTTVQPKSAAVTALSTSNGKARSPSNLSKSSSSSKIESSVNTKTALSARKTTEKANVGAKDSKVAPSKSKEVAKPTKLIENDKSAKPALKQNKGKPMAKGTSVSKESNLTIGKTSAKKPTTDVKTVSKADSKNKIDAKSAQKEVKEEKAGIVSSTPKKSSTTLPKAVPKSSAATKSASISVNKVRKSLINSNLPPIQPCSGASDKLDTRVVQEVEQSSRTDNIDTNIDEGNHQTAERNVNLNGDNVTVEPDSELLESAEAKILAELHEASNRIKESDQFEDRGSESPMDPDAKVNVDAEESPEAEVKDFVTSQPSVHAISLENEPANLERFEAEREVEENQQSADYVGAGAANIDEPLEQPATSEAIESHLGAFNEDSEHDASNKETELYNAANECPNDNDERFKDKDVDLFYNDDARDHVTAEKSYHLRNADHTTEREEEEFEGCQKETEKPTAVPSEQLLDDEYDEYSKSNVQELTNNFGEQDLESGDIAEDEEIQEEPVHSNTETGDNINKDVHTLVDKKPLDEDKEFNKESCAADLDDETYDEEEELHKQNEHAKESIDKQFNEQPDHNKELEKLNSQHDLDKEQLEEQFDGPQDLEKEHIEEQFHSQQELEKEHLEKEFEGHHDFDKNQLEEPIHDQHSLDKEYLKEQIHDQHGLDKEHMEEQIHDQHGLDKEHLEEQIHDQHGLEKEHLEEQIHDQHGLDKEHLEGQIHDQHGLDKEHLEEQIHGQQDIENEHLEEQLDDQPDLDKEHLEEQFHHQHDLDKEHMERHFDGQHDLEKEHVEQKQLNGLQDNEHLEKQFRDQHDLDKEDMEEQLHSHHDLEKEHMKEQFLSQHDVDKEHLEEQFHAQQDVDKEHLEEPFHAQHDLDKESLEEQFHGQHVFDKEVLEKQFHAQHALDKGDMKEQFHSQQDLGKEIDESDSDEELHDAQKTSDEYDDERRFNDEHHLDREKEAQDKPYDRFDVDEDLFDKQDTGDKLNEQEENDLLAEQHEREECIQDINKEPAYEKHNMQDSDQQHSNEQAADRDGEHDVESEVDQEQDHERNTDDELCIEEKAAHLQATSAESYVGKEQDRNQELHVEHDMDHELQEEHDVEKEHLEEHRVHKEDQTEQRKELETPLEQEISKELYDKYDSDNDDLFEEQHVENRRQDQSDPDKVFHRDHSIDRDLQDENDANDKEIHQEDNVERELHDEHEDQIFNHDQEAGKELEGEQEAEEMAADKQFQHDADESKELHEEAEGQEFHLELEANKNVCESTPNDDIEENVDEKLVDEDDDTKHHDDHDRANDYLGTDSQPNSLQNTGTADADLFSDDLVSAKAHALESTSEEFLSKEVHSLEAEAKSHDTEYNDDVAGSPLDSGHDGHLEDHRGACLDEKPEDNTFDKHEEVTEEGEDRHDMNGNVPSETEAGDLVHDNISEENDEVSDDVSMPTHDFSDTGEQKPIEKPIEKSVEETEVYNENRTEENLQENKFEAEEEPDCTEFDDHQHNSKLLVEPDAGADKKKETPREDKSDTEEDLPETINEKPSNDNLYDDKVADDVVTGQQLFDTAVPDSEDRLLDNKETDDTLFDGKISDDTLLNKIVSDSDEKLIGNKVSDDELLYDTEADKKVSDDELLYGTEADKIVSDDELLYGTEADKKVSHNDFLEDTLPEDYDKHIDATAGCAVEMGKPIGLVSENNDPTKSSDVPDNELTIAPKRSECSEIEDTGEQQAGMKKENESEIHSGTDNIFNTGSHSAPNNDEDTLDNEENLEEEEDRQKHDLSMNEDEQYQSMFGADVADNVYSKDSDSLANKQLNLSPMEDFLGDGLSKNTEDLLFKTTSEETASSEKQIPLIPLSTEDIETITKPQDTFVADEARVDDLLHLDDNEKYQDEVEKLKPLTQDDDMHDKSHFYDEKEELTTNGHGAASASANGKTIPSEFGISEEKLAHELSGVDSDTEMSEPDDVSQKFDPLSEWGRPSCLPMPDRDVSKSSTKTGTTRNQNVSASAKATNGKMASKTGSSAKATESKTSVHKVATASTTTQNGSVQNKTSNEILSKARKTVINSSITTPGANASHSKVSAMPAAAGRNGKPSSKSVSSIFHVDLTYIPCTDGDANLLYLDFFRYVRARYYVLSCLEPDVHLLDALLLGKQAWNEPEVEVTLIPTYDSPTLRKWRSENAEDLEHLRITIAPAASNCKLQFSDDDEFPAFKIEF